MTINNKSERNYRGKCLGWPVTSYGADREVLGLRMGRKSQMERSISIGPVQPKNGFHLVRWADLFETFPIGPNRSIQF